MVASTDIKHKIINQYDIKMKQYLVYCMNYHFVWGSGGSPLPYELR